MSVPDFSGSGYLAGEAPDGLTTVVAVPVSATVQVLWRDPDTDAEHLVASTTSASDGTWCITGLNHELEYVVRGIKDGWNDVTAVGVAPTRMDVIAATGVLETNALNNGVVGSMLIEGGLPPYSVSVIDPLPYGLTPSIDYRTLTITGTSEDWGRWHASLRITSANSVTLDVPVTVDINAEWTPENLGTPPKIWLDHESDVTGVSGYASEWANRGSLGGSFSQTNPAARPEILAGALNGNRVLRFDGDDDWLGDDSLGARDIFRNVRHGWALVVYRKRFEDSIAVNRHILSSLTGSSTARFYIRAGSTSAGKNKLQLVVRRLDAGPVPNLAAADENLNWQIGVAVMRWDTGAGYLYSNGRLVAHDDALTSAGSTSDTTPSQRIRLAASGSGSECGDIDMGAAIIHGGDDLIDEDRQRLEGWFAHALGMQVSLDESHPFRHVPPFLATPELQQSFGAGPVILGFLSAASGSDVGAATGPAVTALGTWINGGPSLSSGQGVEVISDGADIAVTLTGITPPATPAQAVLLDHKGMSIATIALTADGSDYTGSVPGALDEGEVYYLRIEAA